MLDATVTEITASIKGLPDNLQAGLNIGDLEAKVAERKGQIADAIESVEVITQKINHAKTGKLRAHLFKSLDRYRSTVSQEVISRAEMANNAKVAAEVAITFTFDDIDIKRPSTISIISLIFPS